LEISGGEKMKVMKRVCFLSVLVIVAVAAQDAMALPSGTYVDNNGKNWEGFKAYQESGYDVVLNWAVYKMSDNPWAAQVDFPPADNYIYAYQLFSSTLSTKDVGYFGLLDGTPSHDPVKQALMHETQAVADGAGIMTNPNPSNDNEQGIWKWTPGIGFVSAGTKSAFLIFSSIYGPTRGSFEVKENQGEDPGVPVPEPGTFILLGVASSIYFTRRTKKRNKP